MKLYRIKNWSSIYENHNTRKLMSLSFVLVPNKHDGLKFRRLSSEPDSAALFGAWMLILQVASKTDKMQRGELIRDGMPITAHDMALMTGFPASVFERALNYFAQKSIGWLEAQEFECELPLSPGIAPAPAVLPAENLPAKERKKEGKKEENSANAASPVRARDVLFDSLAIAEGSDPTQLTKSAGSAIGVAIAEIRKATPNVTPEEIQRRAERYRHVMPQGSTLTASALAKHWGRCTPTLAKFSQPAAQADGHKGWEETLKRIRPESTYDGSWATLPESVKAEIINASKP